MLDGVPILSLLIWLPILGGVLALTYSRDGQNADAARWIGLITAVLTLVLCIPLMMAFDTTTHLMQFQEKMPWLAHYGIYYHLGIDGISMPLMVLTTFTTLVVVLASWNAIKTNVPQYIAAFLVMQGLMVGVFEALDSILFYIFWEAMLIPMYLCIGIWGGDNRTYASIKFFLYTFLGSVLLLVALLYLHNKGHTFSIIDFYALPLTMKEQMFIFFAFFLAFAVKVPMWPVHTWLPDAHTEAPAGGSVVLAALMLKMGVYGFLRFSLPITPDASQALHWMMIALSLIAIVYIGLVAIIQKDMKRLIAYSSVAHMGFVTLGCFMVYQIVRHTGNMQDAYMSLEGAMVQMISHAFSTGAMFFGIGILYDQLHSRLIGDYGGVANKMPVFAALFMLFAMANVGVPGTSGFVGEFMIILSTFHASFWVTFLAATTLVLSASYTLWMYKRVFFGEVASSQVDTLRDVSGPNLMVLLILAFCVIVLGVYPEPLLNVFHASVGHLLEISHYSKLV
jgi:NADH-quinone oxidoreductase subunit M